MVVRRSTWRKLLRVVYIVTCVLSISWYTDFLKTRHNENEHQVKDDVAPTTTPLAPRKRTWQKPINRFVYHYIHKTASTNTRNQLVLYCALNKLNCLTDCACVNKCSVEDCARPAANKMKYEDRVGYGDLTMNRIKTGCCPPLTKALERWAANASQTPDFDALTIPLPRFIPDNAQFIDNTFRDHFRFTLFRHPVEEFISHHGMMFKRRFPQALPPLAEMVEMFYKVTLGAAVPANYKRIHWVITNAQSKAIGWHGNMTTEEQQDLIKNVKDKEDYFRDHDLDNVLKYVGEELDFVGIAGELTASWDVLRDMLGWSKQYFTSHTPITKPGELPKGVRMLPTPPKTNVRRSKSTLDKLDPSIKQKIETIQWADMKLFKIAEAKFARLKSEYERGKADALKPNIPANLK